MKALGVARVLPRLVEQAVLGAAPVLDEAVPVRVAIAVDPLERAQRGLAQPQRHRVVVGPAPSLGEEHEEQRRRVDRAVVAREPGVGCAPAPHLVDDLSRLGIDRRVVLERLQLGERVERADGELGPEQQRLERGDRRVAAEDGHEPRHARGEERAPVLASAHAERPEVDDRAIERTAEAFPPPA